MQAPGGITITDSWGNLLEGVSAEIGSDEMTLQINHAALINGESYTVTIPQELSRGRTGGKTIRSLAGSLPPNKPFLWNTPIPCRPMDKAM
jgi:hypothetical protein